MTKLTSKKKPSSGSSSIPARSSTTQDVPTPFSAAPEGLKPFLDMLDKSKVYITHLDPLPWAFKRQIFIVPVLLNFTIALLLTWRAYVALPTYRDYLALSLGLGNEPVVNTKSKTWLQITWIISRRASLIFLDYCLALFVARWPYTFFLERPGNPVSWRWRVGFQNTEVYVRMSRGWEASDLLDGVRKGEDSAFFKNRILPNVDRKYMQGKTGYLMMGKDFDLDFHLMTRAHELVKQKVLTFDDFRKTVFVWHEAAGWCAWQIHVLDEGGNEEARKKIVAFKEKLTARGKESLFFRWLEVLQYESSQPGGFTPDRQVDAVRKVRELFDREGLDFEALVAEIGGLDGMLGFEDRS